MGIETAVDFAASALSTDLEVERIETPRSIAAELVDHCRNQTAYIAAWVSRDRKGRRPERLVALAYDALRVDVRSYRVLGTTEDLRHFAIPTFSTGRGVSNWFAIPRQPPDEPDDPSACSKDMLVVVGGYACYVWPDDWWMTATPEQWVTTTAVQWDAIREVWENRLSGPYRLVLRGFDADRVDREPAIWSDEHRLEPSLVDDWPLVLGTQPQDGIGARRYIPMAQAWGDALAWGWRASSIRLQLDDRGRCKVEVVRDSREPVVETELTSTLPHVDQGLPTVVSEPRPLWIGTPPEWGRVNPGRFEHVARRLLLPTSPGSAEVGRQVLAVAARSGLIGRL
ncbi:MAG: hypothetical protein AAFZ65_02805, partial [Planctomycetota bacterium]